MILTFDLWPPKSASCCCQHRGIKRNKSPTPHLLKKNNCALQAQAHFVDFGCQLTCAQFMHHLLNEMKVLMTHFLWMVQVQLTWGIFPRVHLQRHCFSTWPMLLIGSGEEKTSSLRRSNFIYCYSWYRTVDTQPGFLKMFVIFGNMKRLKTHKALDAWRCCIEIET